MVNTESLIAFREEWLHIGLSTDRANRPAAEAAIADFYQRINQPAPDFMWVQSPLHAVSTIASLKVTGGEDLGESLFEALWLPLVSHLAAAVKEQISRVFNPTEIASMRKNLWAELSQHISENLAAPLNVALAGHRYEPSYFLGACDAPWVALYLFPHEVLGTRYATVPLAILRGWETLAKSTFWWWPHTQMCLLSERPTTLTFDSGGNLSAFAFADGWGGTAKPGSSH